MHEIYSEMHPFLKWAGGKTQILPLICENIPSDYHAYYEPFLGAGSVLLHLHPRKAIVNDINPFLINCYIQIRDSLKDVLEGLEYLDSKDCDAFFYAFIRDEYNDKIEDNELDADAATYFIWLNKHCFNGLYRVNRHGFFNVPWNKKGRIASYSKRNLEIISSYLNNADIDINCTDFENAVKSATIYDQQAPNDNHEITIMDDEEDDENGSEYDFPPFLRNRNF